MITINKEKLFLSKMNGSSHFLFMFQINIGQKLFKLCKYILPSYSLPYVRSPFEIKPQNNDTP